MKNIDKLRTMTDKELTQFFCNTLCTWLEDICEDNDLAEPCKVCPFKEHCYYGHPGFEHFLNQEVEETKDDKKNLKSLT